MRERPTHWEVVCKTCMAGCIMTDEEASKRLSGDGRTWPKHCGSTMMLRHILVPKKEKEICSNAGCMGATFGLCSCSCRGKYHGVNNPYPQFNRVRVAPLKWYEKPIKTYIQCAPY